MHWAPCADTGPRKGEFASAEPVQCRDQGVEGAGREQDGGVPGWGEVGWQVFPGMGGEQEAGPLPGRPISPGLHRFALPMKVVQIQISPLGLQWRSPR